MKRPICYAVDCKRSTSERFANCAFSGRTPEIAPTLTTTHYTQTGRKSNYFTIDLISKKTALCSTFFLKLRQKPLSSAFISQTNRKNMFRVWFLPSTLSGVT